VSRFHVLRRSLGGHDHAEGVAERYWSEYPLWRRYLASLLDFPLPSKSSPEPEAAGTPAAVVESNPHRAPLLPVLDPSITRVAVVAHPLVAAGLTALLRAARVGPQVVVSVELPSELPETTEYDLLFLSLNRCGPRPMDTVRRFAAEVRVLTVGLVEDAEEAEAALRAGARAHTSMAETPAQIIVSFQRAALNGDDPPGLLPGDADLRRNESSDFQPPSRGSAPAESGSQQGLEEVDSSLSEWERSWLSRI